MNFRVETDTDLDEMDQSIEYHRWYMQFSILALFFYTVGFIMSFMTWWCLALLPLAMISRLLSKRFHRKAHEYDKET